ncbi:MAG TPA: hypothetical protein VJH23_00525 [archaeon]|nr:hypothetical protein [archaeon]
MKPAGFFGGIVLIAAIALLLALSALSAKNPAQYADTESEIIRMQHTAFERAEAEIFLDHAIEYAVIESAFPPVESEKTKALANWKIIESLRMLGIEGFVCDDNWPEDAREEISTQNLGAITKALVTKIGPLTTIEYIFSGGEDGKRHICAKIENGNYSVTLRVPRGYRVLMAVPSP